MCMYVLKATIKLAFIWLKLNPILDNDYSNQSLHYEVLEKFNFFQSKLLLRNLI